MGGNSGVEYRNNGTSALLVPSLTDPTPFVTLAEIRGTEEENEQVLSAFISARSEGNSLLAPSTTPEFIDAMAQVTFGVGGVVMDLFCDVVLGGLIALPASYMRVAVRLNADPSGFMSPKIRIYGGIGTSVRPGSINPQLTFKQPALVALSQGATFSVPPFARRVFALITPFAAVAGAILRFFRENTTIGETAIPPSPAQGIAIPADCNGVAIVSGAVAIANARVIFDLQV